MIIPALRPAIRAAIKSEGSGVPDFSTFDLEGRFLHFKATDGPLDASGNPLTADGSIDQWLDLSGQGNHLAAFDATRRMIYDADGGPGGKPVANSIAKLLRRATLTGGTQTGYTVIMLCRIRPEIAIADCLLSTDTSSVNRLQSQSAGGGGVIVGNFNASSGNSGNMGGIPTGNTDFCLFVVECTDGVAPKGRFGINGRVPQVMPGTPGAYVASAFSLGARYGNLNPSELDVYEIVLINSPNIDDATWNKIREYAAKEFGITSPTAEFPSVRAGLETFQRANTADNNLGTSESGHRYNVTGSGAARARLVDNAYSMVAPWGTSYVYPLTTIKPRVIEWDYEFRTGAGSGQDSTNAVGLANSLTSSGDMIHVLWNKNSLQVQRFHSPNPAENLPLVTYDGTYLSGRIRLEFNFAAGLVVVTGPDGVVTVLDWNANTTAPLSDYNTWNFFYEIIAASTNTLVAAYTRFYWE